MRDYRHLSYGNNEIIVDVSYYKDSISISASYDYMDYGTGNRLGRIYGDRKAEVFVADSNSIEELRKNVLQAIAKAATYGIPEKDLPLEDFEGYTQYYKSR